MTCSDRDSGPADGTANWPPPGVLCLVATPIGNLGDVSERAIRAFEGADYVACEDTRKTRKILSKYGIGKPLFSFHEHNETHAGPRILSLLRSGKSVALATSAGTPGISDPGFTLVRGCIEQGVGVTMVPGPCAFVAALVLSGLPSHSFTFRGFPPRKAGQRRRFLAVDAQSPHTLLFYESPHRLLSFLDDALEVLGDRRAALACELTKVFESVGRGLISELVGRLAGRKIVGEYTVVIEGLGR